MYPATTTTRKKPTKKGRKHGIVKYWTQEGKQIKNGISMYYTRLKHVTPKLLSLYNSYCTYAVMLNKCFILPASSSLLASFSIILKFPELFKPQTPTFIIIITRLLHLYQVSQPASPSSRSSRNFLNHDLQSLQCVHFHDHGT